MSGLKKHEWRKAEKNIYLSKEQPELITIPAYRFFSIEGQGNPNDEFFGEYIKILYSLSYYIKMLPKKGSIPFGYFDYTVYPLEGIWDLQENARKNYNGKINKNDLKFKLMIRQPDFVNEELASKTIEICRKKDTCELFDKVKYEAIEDGLCVQILHVGSYDSEPESFEKIELFLTDSDLLRIDKTHREIYLSDARKTEKEKLKTVLRVFVKNKS